MALNPADKPASERRPLDDLLEANKAQFEQILATQRDALETLNLEQRPPSSPPAGPPPAGPPPAAVSADQYIEPVKPAKPSVAKAAPAAPAPATAADRQLDSLTVDLVAQALANACAEMNIIHRRYALSAAGLDESDDSALIADAKGRLLRGQIGLAKLIAQWPFEIQPGDVILLSDPYAAAGAVGHNNDCLVLAPAFNGDERLGFAAMFAHLADIGSALAGSTPASATSVFAEGLRIPPLKLIEGGVLNQAVLSLIVNNSRTRAVNYGDLLALLEAVRIGASHVVAICERFGKNRYQQACQQLLNRSYRLIDDCIQQQLSREPQAFVDYIDDDGCGNGPFRLQLTAWREEKQAFFDWTGTAEQAPGPINFLLHEDRLKWFIGYKLLRPLGLEDRAGVLNEGFFELIHLTLPGRSLLRPDYPAALGCRAHTLVRVFEVLDGVLNKQNEAASGVAATAAGYGASPGFHYTGTDRHGQRFDVSDAVFGGLAAGVDGDGADGHCWWPQTTNTPTERLENDYPLVVEKNLTVMDSGGAGLHRGGNGIEKVYLLLEPGIVSLHDDRQRSQPWGSGGGQAGQCSQKSLLRQDGSHEVLPAKVEALAVQAGDRIIFRTAGGGGWGEALQRDPAVVSDEVARGLLSNSTAKEQYGVIIENDQLNLPATRALRGRLAKHHRLPAKYDFGDR